MPVALDLYEGAYGPTLRVETHVPEELLSVADLFEALASGTLAEADFSRLLADEVGGVSSLLMSCVPESQEKQLFVGAAGPQGASVRWRGTPAYWRECLEKARALAAGQKPGHQYLTAEGVDDALVELCYQETQL